MSQSSTKIEDLPDNKASNVLNKLNEEIHSDNEEQDLDLLEDHEVQTQEQTQELNYDNILEYAKDSFIVFLLIFIFSNNSVSALLSKLPYIGSYDPHSIMYNTIISLIISLVFFTTKILIDMHF